MLFRCRYFFFMLLRHDTLCFEAPCHAMRFTPFFFFFFFMIRAMDMRHAVFHAAAMLLEKRCRHCVTLFKAFTMLLALAACLRLMLIIDDDALALLLAAAAIRLLPMPLPLFHDYYALLLSAFMSRRHAMSCCRCADAVFSATCFFALR